MPYIRLIIDGQTRLDTDLHEWEERANIMDAIKPPTESRYEPWMIAIQVALVHAIANNEPTAITVTTNGGGWLLDVEHTL